MNSLTENERRGLDDVFLSISTGNTGFQFKEKFKHFLEHIDLSKQTLKPKIALLELKKSFKMKKITHLFSKKHK